MTARPQPVINPVALWRLKKLMVLIRRNIIVPTDGWQYEPKDQHVEHGHDGSSNQDTKHRPNYTP